VTADKDQDEEDRI